MIIIHENLAEESASIARRIKQVYGIDSQLVDKNLTPAFTPIPEFGGVLTSSQRLKQFLLEYRDKKVLILTPKDIYAGEESKNDDWIFGYCSGNLTLVSTSRMKRQDSQPSIKLEIPSEKYLKRLEVLAVHEIGHDVLQDAPHFKEAMYVNDKTGHELWLGPHCDNNTCVMYEIIDIRAPRQGDSHLRLGTEKRFDAGLDDVLERLDPNWFCDRCRKSIKIDESYR